MPATSRFLKFVKDNYLPHQDFILENVRILRYETIKKLFIEEYSNFLKTGELNLEKIKVLEDDDKDILQDIVKNVGKYDAKNEINQMDSFLATVDVKLVKANEDKNKLCPMIIKLSLLFAIGLAILLI